YKHAFSIDQARIMNNNIILDVEKPEFLTSSLVGLSYDDWLASGFGYSYELIVPFTMAEKLGLFMQEDLSRFFPQYKASIEKRRKPYYSIYVEDKEALEG